MMEEVKKRIVELEEAIQHLDFVKRHLNQNASEVICGKPGVLFFLKEI